MPEYKKYDVIIIGAGPAGLFSAISCCKNKTTSVLVLEKMHAAGRKLLLSGSGSCNITHSGNIKDFERKYGKNGRFLRHALAGFSNIDMVEFLNTRGIPTIESENNKIFPESMKAREILDLLLRLCADSGIKIMYSHAVREIQCYNGGFRVKALDRVFNTKYCIITTGGSSYPGTGSTGDGFTLAEKLGHNVTDITSALTPVSAVPAINALTPIKLSLSDITGLTIKNATASLSRNNRKLTVYKGDLLFTHTGLSGPVILDISRYIQPGDTVAVSFIQNDYKSAEEDFILHSRDDGKRSIKNFLHSFGLPERFAQVILDISTIPHDKKTSEISRTERKKIITLITDFPFTITAKGDFNTAMATHGGVCLDEINMRTMESKLIPGLFFAGEVMDIDGNTGGYNLQAAFSTGKLAGDTIRRRI